MHSSSEEEIAIVGGVRPGSDSHSVSVSLSLSLSVSLSKNSRMRKRNRMRMSRWHSLKSYNPIILPPYHAAITNPIRRKCAVNNPYIRRKKFIIPWRNISINTKVGRISLGKNHASIACLEKYAIYRAASSATCICLGLPPRKKQR